MRGAPPNLTVCWLRKLLPLQVSQIVWPHGVIKSLRFPSSIPHSLPTGRPQALSGVPADDGFDSAPASKRGGRIEIKYCIS